MLLFHKNISGMKAGMRPGLWLALLLAVILSLFVVAKTTGMGNNAVRINAEFANGALVSAINSLAMDNVTYGMESLLPSGGSFRATAVAQLDDMQSPGAYRQGRALHGFCPIRGQHPSG